MRIAHVGQVTIYLHLSTYIQLVMQTSARMHMVVIVLAHTLPLILPASSCHVIKTLCVHTPDPIILHIYGMYNVLSLLLPFCSV